MREASHFLLMEMVGSGYVSYRHPESPDVLSYKEVEPRDRLAAAKELLDRVDGKPAQSVSIDSEDVGGAAISIVFPDLSGNAGKTG